MLKDCHEFSPPESFEPKVEIFLSLFYWFCFVIHLDVHCFITLGDKIIYEEAWYNCLNFIGGNIVTCLLLKCCCYFYHNFLKVEGVVRLVKSCKTSYSPGFWDLASYHLTIFIYLLKEMLSFTIYIVNIYIYRQGQ